MTAEEMEGPRRKQDDRRQKISYFACKGEKKK